MRNHPIFFGLLLLAAIGLFFVLAAYAVLTAAKGDAFLSAGGPKIAVVEVEGIISDSRDVVEQLDIYEKNNDVRAVILRINSPGGGVVPSQEIYAKVLKVRERKTVVVSMGVLAASGGYYIASAADRIVANPGTVTGSIGVIMQFSQFDELLEKIGLKTRVIKSGVYKDTGSPFRDMTAEERLILQDMVDDIHDQFIEAVLANRDISREKLMEISEARIFTGRQALKEGLVDELGGFEDAVTVAATLAGIVGEPTVLYPQKKKGLLRYLLSEAASALTGALLENDVNVSYLYRDGIPSLSR
jgi:protease IV